MVLCPDVFEANWDSTKAIAEVCEVAIKDATVSYEKVPLVLCVLSGLMILVCVCPCFRMVCRSACFCVPTHICLHV